MTSEEDLDPPAPRATALARARPILVVITPLVAVATLALGLRVGAGTGVRGAIVYGAPRAAGHRAFAWQVHTLYEDRGVREVVVAPSLTVTARAATHDAAGPGRDTTPFVWTGATNEEGVAELAIDVPGVGDDDAIALDIREPGAREALATGTARLHAPSDGPWGPLGREAAPARATKREGAIALDVFALGQKLVPGVATPVFVRATDARTGASLPDVVVEAEADQGATVATPRATACANGWAEIEVTATWHLAAIQLRARAADGRTGEWLGPIAVSPGAAVAPMPLRIAAERAHDARASAPPVRKVAYVEIDDAKGRAYASALALTPDPYGGASATVTIPPLAPGRYWLVTAHDARGAETLGLGALARPFDVVAGDASAVREAIDRCVVGPELARAAAGGFTRHVALDGFAAKRGRLAATRGRGLAIAVASLVVAALLEAILLVSGALDAKARLARAVARMEDSVASDGSSSRIASPATGGVLVGLLLVLLGFGLLAAIVTYEAP